MAVVPVLVLTVLVQAAQVGTNAEDRAKAQGLLAEGASLYGRGDYLGALDQFNAAYAAYPSAKIWFNIGQTNKVLGRSLEAHDAYQKFLDEATSASPEDRADAEASVKKLRRSLGLLTVLCEVAGAEVAVDGKPAGRAPLPNPVWVTPGRHQVTAVPADSCPMVTHVDVASGSSMTVTLKPRHGALVASAAGGDLDGAGLVSHRRDGWWLGRKWTWVAAGATVALTSAAAIVGYSMRSRFDDLRSSCGVGSPNKVGCSDSDIQSVRDRKWAANILWVAAGAAAATTGVLFFVEGRPVTVVPVAGKSTGVLARVEF
jgi:hypothetical protein